MDNSQAVALIIGVFMPFLITILKEAKFPRWANLLISIVACAGAGAVTVWASGQMDWTASNVLGTIAIIFVAAQATYAAFFKDSEFEEKLDRATSVFGSEDEPVDR